MAIKFLFTSFLFLNESTTSIQASFITPSLTTTTSTPATATTTATTTTTTAASSSYYTTSSYPSRQARNTFSILNARPNRNIPVSDPYATLINKVDTSTPTTAETAAATATDATAAAQQASESISSQQQQSIADQVSDLVDQVNQAANVALEASNQASQIGSTTALSSPSTTEAVTNAATSASDSVTSTPVVKHLFEPSATATTPVESFEKAPSLFDYFLKGNVNSDISNIKNNIQPVVTENVIPTTAKVAKSVLGTTQQGITGLTQSAKSIAATASSSSPTTAADGKAISATFDSEALQTLIANLKLEIYGPWYLAGATFVYALTARDGGKKAALNAYEAELNEAKQKAEEAASAARSAANGARMAKQLVDSIGGVNGFTKEKNKDVVMLENARMEELIVENQLMKVKINRLTKENTEQASIINKLRSEKVGEVNGSSDSVVTSTSRGLDFSFEEEEDVASTSEEAMERDLDEDAKLIEILKGMDEENAKAKALADKKKKKTVKKKMVTVKKKRAPVKKKKEAVVAAAAVEEEKSGFEKIEAAESIFMDSMSDDAGKDNTVNEIKEITSRSIDFDGALDELEANSEVVETEPAPKKKKKKIMKKKVKKKKVVAKVEPKIVAAAPDESNNPWAELKQSTLQRKTIAQLTAYLEEREVDVEGLSKKELVGTIQTL